MATDDTILTAESLSAHPDGLAVSLQIPWYRSLWLSSVSDLSIEVDGEPVPRGDLRVDVAGKSFRVDELPEQWDTLWFVQDRLEVIVPRDTPPAPGERVSVEATLDLRLPYMQIAPEVYVTNHASNHRELVVHAAPAAQGKDL
ncbi:hypothetical protein J2W21_002057 [Sinomonas atrocyanea]|uniref:C-glycoside deglycosidase beta subunit domain-containing protein n=1 Tax=Sinomonas atrocyanea TaxID=37927 RepID=UPI002784977E|nr:DUF6379 domain-containing protein [Sinomonas atrocyanea]MDP9884544.1 hypothetical protein [Sinomonas atrocyanea]